MAAVTNYRCQYCGRSNFKSSHGYTQHLQESKCKLMWLADMGVAQGDDPPQVEEAVLDTDDYVTFGDLPSTPQKAEGNLRDFYEVDPLDVDAVAREIGGSLDEESGVEEAESEGDDDFGGGDDESGHSDTDSDDSGGDKATSPSDSEDEEILDEAAGAGGANTWIREQYKEFAREQVGNTLPFSKAEEASIRLMNVLKIKKAPLNAYRDLMEWHLREKGEIEFYDGIKNCRSFISREVM